jgi:hypothetical protein
VRTGLAGLLAQLFLYASVFYYALRWLGLMQGRDRRNLFLALLIGGAILGVIVPWVADHSLRLAGLGLPVGLILGMIVYVTVDLLLTPADGDGEKRTPALARSATGRSERAGALVGGRRQLLILALLAAIVAHFVEAHFGIAIASTLTHFWTLAALLVVVGMGRKPFRRRSRPNLSPSGRRRLRSVLPRAVPLLPRIEPVLRHPAVRVVLSDQAAPDSRARQEMIAAETLSRVPRWPRLARPRDLRLTHAPVLPFWICCPMWASV